MSAERRESRNRSGDSDDDLSSWMQIPPQDEMLSRGVELGGISDTNVTILYPDNRFTLPRDVEADAESDDQSRLSSSHRLNPSLAARDASTGLQETISTSVSGYFSRTAGLGRPTAGEMVMGPSNWNNTVVTPVDDQRTLNARQPSPLTATQVSYVLEHCQMTFSLHCQFLPSVNFRRLLKTFLFQHSFPDVIL